MLWNSTQFKQPDEDGYYLVSVDKDISIDCYVKENGWASETLTGKPVLYWTQLPELPGEKDGEKIPKLCEILQVQPGRKFRIRGNGDTVYHICERGRMINENTRRIASGYEVCLVVNHPEMIKLRRYRKRG